MEAHVVAKLEHEGLSALRPRKRELAHGLKIVVQREHAFENQLVDVDQVALRAMIGIDGRAAFGNETDDEPILARRASGGSQGGENGHSQRKQQAEGALTGIF